MYTTIFHLPDDQTWTPTRSMLRSMLDFFGPQSVTVVGYERRWRWQAAPHGVLNLPRIMPEQALECLGRARVLHLILYGSPWSHAIAASQARLVPEELARGYVSWDVHIEVGPRTIPDELEERTLCKTCFALAVAGDGVPADLHKYLSLWLTMPPAQAMMDMLHRVSGGMGWRSVISASV